MQSSIFVVTALDAALHTTRRHLMALTCAVGAVRYFDSLVAAARLRMALDDTEQFIDRLPGELRMHARRQLTSLRSMAASVLDLAPTLSRLEICQLRTSDPFADLCAWERVELAWRRDVLQTHFSTYGVLRSILLLSSGSNRPPQPGGDVTWSC